MNIIAEKYLDKIGKVVITKYNGEYRILVEFDCDKGYFHDASGGITQLYGAGTRLNNESEANPVEYQYVLHRFIEACGSLDSQR